MPITAKCARCGASLGVLADELPSVEESCPNCAERLSGWARAYLTPSRRLQIEQRGGYCFCDACTERLFGDCETCRPDEVRELERQYRAPAFDPGF